MRDDDQSEAEHDRRGDEQHRLQPVERADVLAGLGEVLVAAAGRGLDHGVEQDVDPGLLELLGGGGVSTRARRNISSVRST